MTDTYGSHFAGPNASPPATSPLAGGFAAWEETGDVTGLLAAADWLDEQQDEPGDEYAYTPFAQRAAWLRAFATVSDTGPDAWDEDTRFFYAQCGYCGDGRVSYQEARAKAAVELARAERWAGENAACRWEYDEEYVPTEGFEGDAWGCMVWSRDEGRPMESLWGIQFAGGGSPEGPYKRLVEAELALELMPE